MTRKTFTKDDMPGSGWRAWRKVATTYMLKINEPFSVDTSEGEMSCDDGWLALDSQGNPYPIDSKVQSISYELAEEQTTPQKQLEEIVKDRHPSIQHMALLFEYEHLNGDLQKISSAFTEMVIYLLTRLSDGPELTVALRKLAEGKDCAVRQAVFDSKA